MTEHQIRHLKSILTDSKLGANSAQLDEKILQAAEQHSDVRVVTPKRSLILGSAYLQPAVFAIVITIATFIGMDYMVSNEPVHSAALDGQERQPIRVESSPLLDPAMENRGSHRKPDRISVAKRPERSKQALDQILLKSELPETAALMANMDINVDLAEMEQSISFALADIRGMICLGELDDARERYAQLKESCTACRLPSTLELLVLNNQARGPFGTG